MALSLAVTLPAFSQTNPWQIYSADGQAADIDAIVARAAAVEVLLVGELHDDTLGHDFKRALLEALDESGERPIALSLEMFERDVQLVVDEYFAGHITEQHFLASSRPWSNYQRDYRPLVEYARARQMVLIAANPPRRYVNAVSRSGMDVLADHFGAAHRNLPPLPLPPASDTYRQTFFERMSGMSAHGHGNGPDPEHLFEAQRLWDAGMADAIVRHLDRSEGALVMHVAGGFHVEEDTGIPDMLRAYRPETTTIIVAVRPGDAFSSEEHASLGDFVVLTRQ